jgi:sulfopyruvate decarboxylase alpha subunit
VDGWASSLYQALKASGIGMVAYVPDEVTDPLLRLVQEDPALAVVPVTREEEGVAVLAGGYLGGVRGALVLQSSGLGNSLNALSGLCLAYQIPLLLVVSERGRLGEFNPAQVPLGRALPRILEALGIQAFWAEDGDRLGRLVERAAALAFASCLPVAVVLTPTLTGGKVLR